MITLLDQAEKLQETLVKHRRFIHENAETGFELPITTDYVMKQLTAMGYEPKEICQSGITAVAGKKTDGKCFLLRADMDALPIEEEVDTPFKSKTGKMHACGHDLHTAMLLGAAQLLKDNEDTIEGQVKLMFQPAEEIVSGAHEMVKAGLLENPKVNAAMMIHVTTGLPIKPGTIITLGGGKITATSDWFKISVTGKGGHGAMPHEAVDPLNVITHVYQGLQNINAREVKPGDIAVVTVGEIHGGNTGNVIPDSACMQGTIRTFSEETRAFIKERVEQIAKNTAASFRAEVDIDFFFSCPCNRNDKRVLEQIFRITGELLGPEQVLDASAFLGGSQMSGSEDFAYVAEQVPSLSLGLAAGSSEDGYLFRAHSPKAAYDESALSVGAAVYANSAIEWLKA